MALEFILFKFNYVAIHRKQSVMFSCLTNPQIQGIRSSRGIVVVGLISKINLPSVVPFFKRSIVIFSDPDTVICSAACTSSSSKHHYRTITSTPLTPESNAAASLNIPTAMCLTEANSWTVRTTIMHWAASKTLIIRPNVTITKLSITGQEPSESFPTEAVSICTKQGRVWTIVTASDFNLTSLNFPKRFRYHVIVTGCACRGPLWGLDVVPPVRVVSHPVFAISVWKSSNECPSTRVSGHVAIHLLRKRNLSYLAKENRYFYLVYCYLN